MKYKINGVNFEYSLIYLIMAINSTIKRNIIIITVIVFIISTLSILFYQLKINLSLSEPIIDFDYKQSATVGDTIIFINTSYSIKNSVQWEWDFGDDSPLGTGKNAKHKYNLQGKYTVTLKYKTDEPVTKKQLIVVKNPPPPLARFELVSDSIRTGSKVYFKNTSSFANENLWLFDTQGSNSTQISPTFNFDKPGQYEVKLIVANFIGQVDEFSKIITVYGTKVIESAAPGSSTAYKPKYNEVELSEALTALANQGKTRNEKKEIKREIIEDAASITIQIDGMTLENYLNKLQLEASQDQLNIQVLEIVRNSDNKIISLRLKS